MRFYDKEILRTLGVLIALGLCAAIAAGWFLAGCRTADHAPGRVVYVGEGLAYGNLSDARRDSVALADVVILGVVRPEHVAEMRKRNARQLVLQTVYWDVLKPLSGHRWRVPADTSWDLGYRASWVAWNDRPEWWLRDSTGAPIPGWQGHPLPDWSPASGYVQWLLTALAEMAHDYAWGVGTGTVDGVHLEGWYADPTFFWKGMEDRRQAWYEACLVWAAGLRELARPDPARPRLLLTAQGISIYLAAGDDNLRTLWDGIKLENWPRPDWWGSWDDHPYGGLAWAARELEAPGMRLMGRSPAELCWLEVWRGSESAEEWARRVRWAAGTAALLDATLALDWGFGPQRFRFHREVPAWPDIRRLRRPDGDAFEMEGGGWARWYDPRRVLIVNPHRDTLRIGKVVVPPEDMAIVRRRMLP